MLVGRDLHIYAVWSSSDLFRGSRHFSSRAVHVTCHTDTNSKSIESYCPKGKKDSELPTRGHANKKNVFIAITGREIIYPTSKPVLSYSLGLSGRLFRCSPSSRVLWMNSTPPIPQAMDTCLLSIFQDKKWALFRKSTGHSAITTIRMRAANDLCGNYWLCQNSL